jgi:hypothetical protein
MSAHNKKLPGHSKSASQRLRVCCLLRPAAANTIHAWLLLLLLHMSWCSVAGNMLLLFLLLLLLLLL